MSPVPPTWPSGMRQRHGAPKLAKLADMISNAPPNVNGLRAAALAAGFDASLEEAVGCLLTVLAASKPGGRILELGTGAGVGTASLLRGASADSRLTTVELDSSLSNLARRQISDDRVQWVVADAADWLNAQPSQASFAL